MATIYWTGVACDDCTIILANDDDSGMSEERANEVRTAIHLHDENLVIGDQTDDFSWEACDVCKSHLAGSRHEVISFGPR